MPKLPSLAGLARQVRDYAAEVDWSPLQQLEGKTGFSSSYHIIEGRILTPGARTSLRIADGEFVEAHGVNSSDAAVISFFVSRVFQEDKGDPAKMVARLKREGLQ